jgi:SPP1 gp7 family putative phage head morphogenesis protein
MLTQELFDRQVEHMIQTRRYSEAARVLIENESSRYRASLAKVLRKDSRFSKNAEREVTRHVRSLYSLSRSSVDDFLGAEVDFQANNLRRSVGSFYDVKRPTRAEIAKLVTKSPLRLSGETRSHGTMKEAFQSLGDREMSRVQRRVRQGIADGTSMGDIIKEVQRSSRLTEAQAKTLVTTNMTRAEQLIKEKLYDSNDGVINGLIFTAILDSRTSTLCSSYDGLFQTKENLKVRPPLHWNCRSSLAPVLKSRTQMLESGDPRFNLEKLATVPPSQLQGGKPLQETFSQWLSRQKHETKLKYLKTDAKVALFEGGALDLSSFFTAKGNPISLAKLRVQDNLLTYFSPIRQFKKDAASNFLPVGRPFQLMQSKEIQKNLRAMIISDAADASKALSLTDFRGTTLAGKRGVRRRANNTFDPRNNSFNPMTGEVRSTLNYDPNFTLYRERLDYLDNSKLLTVKQKTFIKEFTDSLEDRVSVNQQSVVVENLRVLFERYAKDGTPWDDFVTVLRAEQNYSVTNVSRLLDRRSRASSELFLNYRGDSKEPSVMIQGNRVPLSSLHSDKIQFQRFVNDWRDNTGSALARKMYYKGNAPWRSYFFRGATKPKSLNDKLKDSFYKRSVRKLFYKDDSVGFFTRFGKTPDKWKKITLSHIKDKIKGSLSYYKFLEKLSEEGVSNFIRRAIREQYRDIVDLEFIYRRRRNFTANNLLKQVESNQTKKAISVMSGMMQTVAEGRMTDYDGLAIALGRDLKKNWPGLSQYVGASLQDYHREGSKILDYMKRQGLIRVNSRGVTKRATTDLDTGRQSGHWKDTVSREVQVLDSDMLELQDRFRKLELANRVGIDRPENKLYVVAGKKSYVDARGNDTGVPVITRSAFEKFDAKQLDKDFADMLNHTMSLEYEVDPTFASFMDDLVRFKDQRGKADFYDDLNVFREEIVRRGDQGYGLMETVRYYNSTGNKFTVPARIDGRGRVYYNGYLTPTGGEVIRPFLNSAKATPMTPAGLNQIKIQMASVISPGTEALTNAGRMAIFQRNEEAILRVGKLLSATTQRDRRIREFLTDPFIQSIHGEEIAKISRFALEYYRIHKHTGGKFDADSLRTFRSKLMGESDASASGLQVIALSTGNRGAALTSNVMPTTRKNRIYDLVAQDVVADPRFQALMEELGMDLTWEDLQKASKYQVMIAFYGAGPAGQRARVAAELSKVLRKQDVTVTTRAEFLSFKKIVDAKVKEAEALGAFDTADSLKTFRRELTEMVEKHDYDIGATMLLEAEEIHPDVADLVRKYTNSRGSRVGPKEFTTIAKLMSEKLAERAPVTETYITFWKRVAQDYARVTKKVDIPWVTFDNKTLMQKYRPKIQQEIRFFDPGSKRYIRNIYQMSAEDGKLLGKGSVGDVRLGFGVNGNHALDASLVRGYHLLGKKLGLGTSTIHDAIFMNINELDAGIDAMFQTYAKARDFNNVKATLDALRKEGLPNDLYKKYLQEAYDEGFISDGFTSDEILAPLKPGYDRYGFGP